MDTYTHLKEIIGYLQRRLVWFEKMFSPPKPKAKTIDAVDFDKQEIHIHIHTESKEEPMGHWEKIYRNLLKGF